MNFKQALILALSALLLALMFVFPYSSYPTKQEADDGRSMTSTVRWGFVPIWQVREQEKEATVPGNLFDHAIIQWPVVIGLAAAIALAGGWMFLGARTSSQPSA